MAGCGFGVTGMVTGFGDGKGGFGGDGSIGTGGMAKEGGLG